MYDPIVRGLAAAGSTSAAAFPMVFAAGAVSSIGPCVAPRFLAVAGLASNGRSRNCFKGVFCFVGGLVAVYAAFGAVASLLSRVTQASGTIYAAVAIVLGFSGICVLWRGGEPVHEHSDTCASPIGSGGAFFLGASFALVVSPCCTPVVAAILAYTSAAGAPVYGGALMGCFALGHALPLFAVGAGARGFGVAVERYAVRQAASVLSAALMLALAGYYAVLV